MIISPRSRPNRTSAATNSASPTKLREIDGVTTAMLVKFGENDVKTVEDLAGCATDDLVGWTEKKDGETVKTRRLSSTASKSSREEAEAMIMAARVQVGWMDEADACRRRWRKRTRRRNRRAASRPVEAA